MSREDCHSTLDSSPLEDALRILALLQLETSLFPLGELLVSWQLASSTAPANPEALSVGLLKSNEMDVSGLASVLLSF